MKQLKVILKIQIYVFIINNMKKILSNCNECGENKTILTQVSCLVEIIYLCSDCYKDKYTEEVREEIEKENYLIPKIIQH